VITDDVDEEALKERKQVKSGLLCVFVVEVVSLFMSMASLNIKNGIDFLLSPSHSLFLTLRRRIKSHLLFAGIIRSSPFSPR